MAGTKAGAQKAKEKILRTFGADFYRETGRKGGSVSGIAKGFALNPEKAAEAGRKGGRISRRGPAKNKRSMVRTVNDGESLAKGGN